MAEPFIGEIRIFPYTFPPRGWAWCNGQIMPISQNSSLFNIIGNIYGGDGRINFALPNLQGRTPMHRGKGSGLTDRAIGQSFGSASVKLTEANLPKHDHTPRAVISASNKPLPDSNVYPAQIQRNKTDEDEDGDNAFSFCVFDDQKKVRMSASAMATAGESRAHLNRQPYLGLNFCIAQSGVMPPRP